MSLSWAEYSRAVGGLVALRVKDEHVSAGRGRAINLTSQRVEGARQVPAPINVSGNADTGTHTHTRARARSERGNLY